MGVLHYIATTTALFALQVTAQTTPALNPSAFPTAVPTVAAQDADLENVVNFLLPSASITSLSPSQSSAILSDAQAYLQSYTQASPIAELETKIFLDQLLGATTSPSAAQQSQLEALFNNAQADILANPSGFAVSVSTLVAPFAFASDIYSYENGIIDGLRTVVAKDVGASVPASTTSTSTALAPKATGLGMSAIAAVAGLVGVGLL
ncbi:MAG: hypothetical protein GOMPHAMPRED_002807 [Gomphillus americanus]|uniref:Uncharacterized protein n=1 Tax=Gomphillus americanus TaxID=1940652 RepID=A0A8H3IJL6_9LECA|nr:MAG: hypothetical protein GOMPHAMPRED_002807 [Gomphillus americanus]